MKCKHCGGVLQFQNGVCLCQSCGATFTLDSVYENIDVCICYEENDGSGRRTKDSIIAQEVYRRLEEKKIATFYERISADGMIEDDLEASKLAAINRAKIIIVLGASAENFSAIETKYGGHFNGKAVIPFCVDINPNAIPKTLSKIQAMNYSTIGWDKDLIKGINNILGKEQAVDTGSLYGHRKRKIIAITLIAVVVAVAIFVAGWFLVNSDEKSQNTETSTPSTEASVETTEKPLTQKEIYDNATEYLDQGDLVEALELLSQIPDHPNSANMIKQIYSKYEGYYKNENAVIHVEIVDNIRVELEINITSDQKVVRISTSAQIASNVSTCDYIDNHNESGKIDFKLENTGIKLKVSNASQQTDEFFFNLLEKSSQPIVQITAEMLLDWLKEEITIEELTALGYELEHISHMDRAGANRIYRIQYTEIYLSILGYVPDFDIYSADTEGRVYGVAGPAELIAPSKIGNNGDVFSDGGFSYFPGSFLAGDASIGFWPFDWVGVSSNEGSNGEILNNTLIGVCLNKYMESNDGVD